MTRNAHLYVNAMAITAIVVTLGSGAYAAVHLPTRSVGTAQLRKGAIVSSKVKNGSLLTKDLKAGQLRAGAVGSRGAQGASGSQGSTGDTGPQGDTGAAGPSGIVATVRFTAMVGEVPGGTAAWTFVGTTSTLTTAAGERLTGIGEAPLGSKTSTSGQAFDYGLCYQPTAGGAVVNFVGSWLYSTGTLFPDRRTYAAAASVVPGAGTWRVGFCVRNPLGHAIDNNDFADGWVQVTN